MRGLILVLIGMGLYYSRHKRRVHLQKKCRFQVFKVEKMLKSATLWFESMGVSGNERVTLERSLAAFFWACHGDSTPMPTNALEKEDKITS